MTGEDYAEVIRTIGTGEGGRLPIVHDVHELAASLLACARIEAECKRPSYWALRVASGRYNLFEYRAYNLLRLLQVTGAAIGLVVFTEPSDALAGPFLGEGAQIDAFSAIAGLRPQFLGREGAGRTGWRVARSDLAGLDEQAQLRWIEPSELRQPSAGEAFLVLSRPPFLTHATPPACLEGDRSRHGRP